MSMGQGRILIRRRFELNVDRELYVAKMGSDERFQVGFEGGGGEGDAGVGFDREGEEVYGVVASGGERGGVG